MMIAACDAAPRPDLPPVPAALIASDELPLGDATSARLTRASLAVRDRIEPDAGPLEARIYLLPRKQVQPFVASLAQPPAPGWTIEQPPERQADGSLLAIYARGGRVLAYLLLDKAVGERVAVQRLYNVDHP